MISSDTILKDAALTLMMAHSGNSSLIHPKTGEHLMFTQYNKDVSEYYNSNLLSPLGWAEKYFFDDGEIITIPRSLASLSLIKSILDMADDNDLLIFTRPAANAEVKIITSLHTGEQANMDVSIDNLTLFVNIDYQTASTFSNILVNSSNGLMPLILCSQPDISGKDNGWGNFTRSYSRNAGTIVFTAPETHGIYKFDKWLKTTNSVTEEIHYKSVSVSALYHHWLTAVYKLNVPRLDLPDTVFAAWNQGILDIPVKNSNVIEQLPMNWFALTEGQWATIQEGTDKGTEEGTIRLVLSDNNDTTRTTSLMVYAVDAVNPEKEVTIIQNQHAVGMDRLTGNRQSIRIYPNPAGSEISVELPDEIAAGNCTVTILSMDGKMVFRQDYPSGVSGVLRIPVEGLPPGLYLVRAVRGEFCSVSKFSKF